MDRDGFLMASFEPWDLIIPEIRVYTWTLQAYHPINFPPFFLLFEFFPATCDSKCYICMLGGYTFLSFLHGGPSAPFHSSSMHIPQSWVLSLLCFLLSPYSLGLSIHSCGVNYYLCENDPHSHVCVSTLDLVPRVQPSIIHFHMCSMHMGTHSWLKSVCYS